MENEFTHATHPKVISRLKRANEHLPSVTDMIEQGSPCLGVAQQLHAVETAVINAKRVLIHDHIDHCLEMKLRATVPTRPRKVFTTPIQLCNRMSRK